MREPAAEIKIKTILIFLFGLIIIFPACAQQKFIPMNYEFGVQTDRQLNALSSFTHTGFKPYLESKINFDSLTIADSTHFNHPQYKKWFSRKVKTESLLIIDSGEFHLSADPLMEFNFGLDFANGSKKSYTNTRGFLIQADLGKNVSLMSSFLENQSFLPSYLDTFVKNYQVVPGNGRIKPFKKTGYDYAMVSGYVSWSPIKELNFQAGHDKNFIGDGYRSLLLSDNAFNYPFFKSTSSFFNNRIQLVNLYTQLSSLERIPQSTTPEALFKPKAGTFHYLSIIPFKRLTLGFFEGIIWQRWDSTGSKPFNWNFVNPVIFANTLIYGLNGKNNSLIGLNIKFKILKNLISYSQFFYDNKDKYGYQAGLKYFDILSIKNLNCTIEYNRVTPYSYSHKNPLQNYSHYNQPLAHPAGAYFNEIFCFANYLWKDFFVQIKTNFILFSKDSGNLNLGHDIFISNEYPSTQPVSASSNKEPYPNQTEIQFLDFKIGYLFNRNTNLNFFVGLTNRIENNSPGVFPAQFKTQLFYFGIRTSISNRYFDF